MLIPEPDPALLAQLNGKEILIKIYQGNKIRETIKVPIKTSPDLRVAGGTVGGGAEASPEERKGSAKSEASAQKRLENAERGQTTTRPEASAQSQPVRGERGWGQLGLWVLQIINFVLLVCLGVYGIFFMLPKIQVLQDRLAKNEMFIHGSREAIREEIEQIKQEILMQCEPKPPEE